MRVGRVLNKLTEKGLYYQFAGSPEQEVTMVQKIEGCNRLGEGMLSCESMLYVCEKDHRSYVEQTPDKVLPCVIAKDSTDCRRILHIANKILLEKYCEEMNLLSLYKNIAERTSPAVAICLCETVMGNPCALLDIDLRMIASSGVTDEEVSSVILSEDGMIRREIIMNAEKKSPFRRYILCSLSESEYAEGKYFFVLERKRPFKEEEDLEKALQIVRALSGFANRTYIPVEKDADAFLRDLVEGSGASSKTIVAYLKALNWQFSEKYYVFTIDLTINGGKPFAQDAFEGALHAKFFDYEQYRIAILRRERPVQLLPEDLGDVSELLTAHKLRAGISHGFYDISRLKHFFKQSVKCIELGLHYNRIRPFEFFENLPHSTLIDVVVRHDEIDLVNLCHPLFLDVYEYDKENGTDYLNSLTAYVMMGQSIQKAAELMHVHKNTMYTRTTKLKELFYIDFDNARLISAFRFAIMVFSYLGIVDIQEI